MKKTLLVSMLLFSVQTFAATYSVTGKVTQIIATDSANYNSYVGIEVAGLPVATCIAEGRARVAIDPDHPLYSSVVSMATTALVANLNVKINYSDTCTVSNNSWDFNYMVLYP